MKTNSTQGTKVFIVWYVHASHIDEREMENGRCYMIVPNLTAFFLGSSSPAPTAALTSVDGADWRLPSKSRLKNHSPRRVGVSHVSDRHEMTRLWVSLYLHENYMLVNYTGLWVHINTRWTLLVVKRCTSKNIFLLAANCRIPIRMIL